MKPPQARLAAPDDTAALSYVCAWLRERILLDGLEHDAAVEDLARLAPLAGEHYRLCVDIYERAGRPFEGVVTTGFVQRYLAERRG